LLLKRRQRISVAPRNMFAGASGRQEGGENGAQCSSFSGGGVAWRGVAHAGAEWAHRKLLKAALRWQHRRRVFSETRTSCLGIFWCG